MSPSKAHLLCGQALTLKLISEAFHIVLKPACLVAQRQQIGCQPVGRIMVGRIEALVQELQLRAEILNVPIEVLKRMSELR